MAVTKIRKVSSSTLLALSVISVIIFAVFFFGGAEVDAKGNKDYAYTGLLLFWTYALFLVTFAATVMVPPSLALMTLRRPSIRLAGLRSPICGSTLSTSSSSSLWELPSGVVSPRL